MQKHGFKLSDRRVPAILASARETRAKLRDLLGGAIRFMAKHDWYIQ
jgi:hypothetical protein